MSTQKFTSQDVPIGFKKNAGGLNSTSGPLNLQENESPDLQNVDFNKFGSILKRNGYTAVNTSAFNSSATWTSLYWLELSTGEKYLMGTCGNKLGTWANGVPSGSPTDSTGVVIITAGNNNLWDWTTFLDTALGTNNVDVPITWTGSGNAAAMTVPTNLTKAQFITVFNSYVFLANVTVAGTVHSSRVYWSTVGSITSWPSANFSDVSRNDGQQINGIFVLGEELIIFKNTTIWKATFTGDNDVPFLFVKTRSTVGAISGYSIQQIDNGLFFLAADGYYYFDGNNSFKVSDRITTTLQGYALNRFSVSNSVYQTVKNRYWGLFTTNGGTTHNRVITWDNYNNAFGLYTGIAANCFSKVVISGQERIFFGDFSGFVYEADTGADDYPLNVQTAISAYWNSKWHDYDDIVNQKGTDHVYLYYQNNNATNTFAYSYDFDSNDTYSQTFSTAGGSSLYGTATYDSTDTYAASGGAVTRFDLTGRGRVVRFKVSNATLTEAFQIDGVGTLPHLETQV